MSIRESEKIIYLIAGEPSGDTIGADLIDSLNQNTKEKILFCGVGGPKMKSLGLNSLFPIDDLSIMGFAEIIPHIPKLLKRIQQVKNDILAKKPCCVITIDSPDFNFRVGNAIKNAGIPLVHYVAPTVWAYRKGRAKKISKFLNHLLVLYPFEPKYFTKFSLPCTFVGHPLVNCGIDKADPSLVKEKFNASDSDVFITLLPGSRISEINRHFELFKQTINIVKVTQPNIKILLPTLPGLQNKLKSLTTDWGLPVHIVTSKEEKYSGFAASQAALAVSGTVALELAIACVPMVIAYKANFITAAIAKRIVKLPQVSLGNILMESEVCPEYLQEKATPFNLAYALNNLLDNEVSRSKQIELWKRIPEKLSAGPDAPSKYAAKIILDIIEK